MSIDPWECMKHMTNGPCRDCAREKTLGSTVQNQIDGLPIKPKSGETGAAHESVLEFVEKPLLVERSPRQILRAVVEQYSENNHLTWVDMAVSKLMLTLLDEAEWMNDVKKNDGMGAVEANFGFYVDGWTLHATGVIGQVLCKHLDGREVMIPNRVLTAFIERRLPDVGGEQGRE